MEKTFQDFGAETSISGINNAAKGKSKLRSLIWFLIFSVLAYFTVDGIYEIVIEYFEYPVITSTDIKSEPEVDFPAVTICNLNRVNCHNAFMAMYTIKKQLVTGNYQTGEKDELERSLSLYEQLLSSDVTNCLYPVCLNIKTKVNTLPIQSITHRKTFINNFYFSCSLMQ